MDVAEFEHWLGGIASLNEPQRRQAWQALALSEAADSGDVRPAVVDISTTDPAPAKAPAWPSQRAGAPRVAELGQRRVDIIGCPHCDCRDVAPWGTASALPRYRCKTCRRTFNALTKTPLARLRMKDKWVMQVEAMIDGVSIAKAAKRCDVDDKTAFRWRHRFLASLASDKPATLAVIVARDRQGATTDAVLPKLNRVSITAALGGAVTSANEFCCDGGSAIVAFARKARIPTHILPAPGKPSPQAPDFHINNVNAYHSRFKGWMRRFHGVATKNLSNYLGWRRTLEALGPTVTPDDMILGAIGLGPYQQVTAL